MQDERELLLLLEGLLADGEIVPSEVKHLEEWLGKRESLEDVWLYDSLHCRIKRMLADHVITLEEQRSIIDLIVDLKDPKPRSILGNSPEAVPFDVPTPKLHCSQSFCLTGVFRVATRDYCSDIITKYGGECLKNVRKNDCILVVGSLGWINSKPYSSKVSDAIKFRNDGGSVFIVQERDWWGVFGQHCKSGLCS